MDLEKGDNLSIWLINYHRKATEFIHSMDYDQFVLDIIFVNNIIKFVKGKPEKNRQSIFRIFGFLWKIMMNISDKYKNIYNDFMDLTK